MADFFTRRLVNEEWREVLGYLSRQSKALPVRWRGYANIYGIVKLFPSVETFVEMGHRGHVLNVEDMKKVERLWLDSPLSRFSVILLELSYNNVKHLVVNCGHAHDLLNKTSRIHWPQLECLCVMIETISTQDLNLSYWKMPKLKDVLIGTPTSVFPMCLQYLPIAHVKTLSVVSDALQDIPWALWFMSFMRIWRRLQHNKSVRVVRFECVVPETEGCICSLVQALNGTLVERVYLRPCSVSTAIKVLNNTTVTLMTAKEKSTPWTLVKFAYGDRLQLV